MTNIISHIASEFKAAPSSARRSYAHMAIKSINLFDARIHGKGNKAERRLAVIQNRAAIVGAMFK